MRVAQPLLLFTLLLALASCRQRTDGRAEDEDLPSANSPLSYEEGDTLRLKPGMAPNLEEWMTFHASTDSAWRMNRFLASGVSIHLDSMEVAPALSSERMQAFAPLLSWSPDGSLCIDIWSYNRLIETDRDGKTTLVGGGPDQMVVLSDRSGRVRSQVMFNGPMQLAETADWISNDAFLLGMLNIDEAEGTFVPEILLFNLADTVYTNFRIPDSLPLEGLSNGEGGFVDRWLKGKGLTLR